MKNLLIIILALVSLSASVDSERTKVNYWINGHKDHKILSRSQTNYLTFKVRNYHRGDFSCSNATKRKEGKGYIIRPGLGNEVKIQFIGRREDGTTAKLRVVHLKVVN